MKASVFTGVGNFKYKDIEISDLNPNDVLVKNMFCGVCGTDIHIFHGEPGSADVTPPVVLGHEYSGEIIKTGSAVTTLSIGDHVTIDPNIYCGKCEYCRNGKKQMCKSMEAIGVTRDGGFAEYSVVPESQAFIVDKTIPFEHAAMAEPLACCIHGIDLADIKVGDNVLIIGGGAIGLIIMQLAKMSGAAKVALSEPNEMRRLVASKIGADYTFNPVDESSVAEFYKFMPNGADVVIECAGSVSSVKSSVTFANKGANILLFSVPKPEATFELPLMDVFKKELTIKGSFVNPDTHLRAVELINSKAINFDDIITHTFPLDKLKEAIETQMSSDSLKVIVKL